MDKNLDINRLNRLAKSVGKSFIGSIAAVRNIIYSSGGYLLSHGGSSAESRGLGSILTDLQEALDMRIAKTNVPGFSETGALEKYEYFDEAIADIYNYMGLVLFEQQSNLREATLNFQIAAKV